MRQLVGSLIVIALAACGGPSRDNPQPDAEGCSPGDPPQCSDRAYQTCECGEYVTQEVCPTACSPTMGCVECNPALGNACNCNDVVSCKADGSFGNVVDT